MNLLLSPTISASRLIPFGKMDVPIVLKHVVDTGTRRPFIIALDGDTRPWLIRWIPRSANGFYLQAADIACDLLALSFAEAVKLRAFDDGVV